MPKEIGQLDAEAYRRSLIKFSQFVLNRETEDVRDDLCRSLIEMALYMKKQRMTFNDINEILDTEYSVGKMSERRMKSSIDHLIEQKKVLVKDGLFFLSNERREEIARSIQEKKKLENAINDNLIDIVRKNYGPLSENQENQVKEIFQFFMARLFTTIGALSARTLVWGYERGEFPAKDILKIFDETSSKLKDQKLINVLKSSIIELLSKLTDPNMATYLYSTIQNYFFFEILSLDPECQLLEKKALSNTELYLDTNVILDLLLPTRSRHNLATELVKLAKDMGMSMKFTLHTRKEFIKLLASASENFTAFSNRISEKGLEKISIFDEGFIQDFFHVKASNPGLTFDGYCATFKKGLKKILEEKFDIKLDSDSHEDILNSPQLAVFNYRVAQCGKAWNLFKDEDVVVHDAFHLLLIREIRRRSKPDVFGPKYWFITFDNSLYCVSQTLRPRVTMPLSVRGDIWVHTMTNLLPLNIFEKERVQISKAFLGFCASSLSASFPRTNLSKLRVIAGPWMEFKWVSTEDIAEIVSKKFVEKYIREAQELLEKGKSPKPASEIITAALDETVSDKMTKMENEMKELRNELKNINEAREKEANERKEMEKQLSNVRSVSKRDRFLFVISLILFFVFLDLYFASWWQFLVGVELALMLGVPSLLYLIKWLRGK